MYYYEKSKPVKFTKDFMEDCIKIVNSGGVVNAIGLDDKCYVFENWNYAIDAKCFENVDEDADKQTNRNYLPDDVNKVIIQEKTVIVILKNGQKGVSTCASNDEFDEYIGYSIALQRARDGYAFQLKKVLASCIESAKNKGYLKAILKNTDK